MGFTSFNGIILKNLLQLLLKHGLANWVHSEMGAQNVLAKRFSHAQNYVHINEQKYL